MSFVELLALGQAIAKLAEEAPEVVQAVERLLGAARGKEPLTPALRHFEAVASAKQLGIPYPS